MQRQMVFSFLCLCIYIYIYITINCLVTIRDAWLQHPGPRQKSADYRRAQWPKELTDDASPDAERHAFQSYLQDDKNYKTARAEITAKLVDKFLAGFEVEASSPVSDGTMLVSMYMQDKWKQMFKLPIYSQCFTWSLKTIDAFALFIEFHRKLHRRAALNQKGSAESEAYACILEDFADELRSGFRSRYAAQKEVDITARRRIDAKRIKNMPSIAEMQQSVGDAFLVLKGIVAVWADQKAVPVHVQYEANVVICGAIWMNTFGGRKHEWEIATYEHVMDQLMNDKDYIVCTDHKTSSCYGDLAKLLTPGLCKVYVFLVCVCVYIHIYIYICVCVCVRCYFHSCSRALCWRACRSLYRCDCLRLCCHFHLSFGCVCFVVECIVVCACVSVFASGVRSVCSITKTVRMSNISHSSVGRNSISLKLFAIVRLPIFGPCERTTNGEFDA